MNRNTLITLASIALGFSAAAQAGNAFDLRLHEQMFASTPDGLQIGRLQEILQVQEFRVVERRPPNRRSSEER